MEETLFDKAKLLLPFSDTEIAFISKYIPHYIKDNVDSIDKIDCMNLGILYCNLQYIYRNIREMILNYTTLTKEYNSIILMCELFNKYPDMVDYIIESYMSYNANLSTEKVYELYVGGYKPYYYNLTEEEKETIIDSHKILYYGN